MKNDIMKNALLFFKGKVQAFKEKPVEDATVAGT
jgi:hypothetical protein